MNPIVSSSHKLHHLEEKLPLRSNSSTLDSSPEFDFCVGQNSDEGFCHADDLFSGGKILPLFSKNKIDIKNNPKSLSKSDGTNRRSHSDVIDEAKRERLTSGFGFRLLRSKSVGFSLRKTKKDSSFASDYRNVDRKKSLQKMNSTERASKSGIGVSNPVLNVPLADMFCLGSAFSGGKDKKKMKQ